VASDRDRLVADDQLTVTGGRLDVQIRLFHEF
jgi:hypothetical protein